MLAELDVAIFLKSHDDLDRTAERVFGSLRSQYEGTSALEYGGNYFSASGLGFTAALFGNEGEVQDPEFEAYQFTLEITSHFWCVDLDGLGLESPLSEYYARQLAFDLDLETATEVLLETTEEAEIFEIRAYRRNSQYRLDQAPTTPKAFVIEARRVEEPFQDEESQPYEDEQREEAGEREEG